MMHTRMPFIIECAAPCSRTWPPMASNAPNALYGPEDLMNTVLAMCSQNQFVATCVRAMV